MKHSRRKRLPGVIAMCILFVVLATLVVARTAPDVTRPVVSPPPMQTPVATAVLPQEEALPPTSEVVPATGAALPQELPGRYEGVELTEEDIDTLAALVFLEAGNQSAEGQQAVVEVVLNRVIADNFPDTLHEVIFQGFGTKQQQFTPAGQISTTAPSQEQYDAIDAALYGEPILPEDVVYFSTKGENSRVWGKIGDHVFCRQYVWGVAP